MSKLKIINAALLITGNSARQMEKDGSPEWLISDAHYTQIVEAELERNFYAFARKSTKVESRLPGDFGFDTGYQLPGDCIIARRFFIPRNKLDRQSKICPITDWEIASGIIYFNERAYRDCLNDPLHLEYTTRDIDVSDWPPNFRRGIEYRMAAVLSRGANEEEGVANGYDAQADLNLRIARNRSGVRDHKKKYASRFGRLKRAHHGGR